MLRHAACRQEWPPEFQLLTLCVRENPGDAQLEILDRLLATGLDWDELVSLARRHRVIPQVCRLLAVHGHQRVPRSQLQTLTEAASAIARKNLGMAAELAQIARRFNDAEVPLLSVKGPLLAQDFYGGIERRQFRDLDIAVRESDLVKSVKLLTQAGFDGPGSQIPSLSARRRQWLVKAHRELPFRRAAHSGPVEVELQWRLADDHQFFTISPDRLWGSQSRRSFAGTTIHTLPDPERLLYLAYHGSRHRWKRLSWLCDFTRAWAARPHGSDLELIETARTLGTQRCLAAGISLAREVAHVDNESNSIDHFLASIQRLDRNIASSQQALLANESYFEDKPLYAAAWYGEWSDSLLGSLSGFHRHLLPSYEDLCHHSIVAACRQRLLQVVKNVGRLALGPHPTTTLPSHPQTNHSPSHGVTNIARFRDVGRKPHAGRVSSANHAAR